MMIGICFHTYKKNKSPKALYFLMLFMFTLIFTVFFSLLPLSLASYNQLMTFRWIIVFEGFTVLLILHRDLFSSKIQAVLLEKNLLEERQSSLTKYLQGLLNERGRISRELHDSISSNLSALGRRIDSDNKKKESNTDFYFAEIQKIQENVREISHDLHTFSLDKKSLVQAINDEIFRLENYFNSISFEINIIDTENQLMQIEKSKKEIIYFTFLELIENALKHAKTNNISIQIIATKKEYILIIEDDGVGYDPQNISENGIGLISIHERINQDLGKFEILPLEKGMKHIFTLFHN
jgi:signal transduction histidine kinase